MITIRSFLLCCTIILLQLASHGQQHVSFSQYIFNGMLLNPAIAGAQGDWNMNGYYRHQWAGFPGAPRTGGISIDGLTAAPEDRVGVGGLLLFDKLGPQQSFSLYGSYAYRIPLGPDGDRRLSFGLGGGFTQFSINGNVLETSGGDIDEAVPLGRSSTLGLNAHFGVYYSTSQYYVGASVMDLLNKYNNIGLYWGDHHYNSIRRRPQFYLTGGYRFDVSDDWNLQPSLLLRDDFKGSTSLDVNILAQVQDLLWLGSSLRTGMHLWGKPAQSGSLETVNAVNIMVGYAVMSQLRVSYSYEIAVGKTAGYQQGSHELSIGYLFRSKGRAQRLSERLAKEEGGEMEGRGRLQPEPATKMEGL